MDLPFETPIERSSGVRESLSRIVETLKGDWLAWARGGSSPDILALTQYREEEQYVFIDKRRTTLRRW